MASEPVPEPLPNQEVDAESDAIFPAERQIASTSTVPDKDIAYVPPARSSERWHAAAQILGVALGRAVNRARDLSRRTSEVTERTRQTAGKKVTTAKERAAGIADNASRTSAEAYADAKARVADTLDEAKQTAARRLDEARTRAQNIADEFPLQVIAGTAGAAFLAGVMLRIWRSSRDE